MKLIEGKSKDLVINTWIRVLGSVLVALSGLVLFTDKVANFSFINNFGFIDTKTFLWVLSQTISPLLLAFSVVFRPYKVSYLIPIYIYVVQLYWVFRPSIQFDDYLIQSYAIGSCVLYILMLYVIRKVRLFHDWRHYQNQKFQKEATEIINSIKGEDGRP